MRWPAGRRYGGQWIVFLALLILLVFLVLSQFSLGGGPDPWTQRVILREGAGKALRSLNADPPRVEEAKRYLIEALEQTE